LGQPLFPSKSFVDALDEGIGNVGSSIRFAKDPTFGDRLTSNSPQGVKITRDGTNFIVGIASTAVPRGLEQHPTALGMREIQNATSLVIGTGLFGNNYILDNRSRYDTLSRGLGDIPVFVFPTVRDTGSLYLFENGFEPVQIRP